MAYAENVACRWLLEDPNLQPCGIHPIRKKLNNLIPKMLDGSGAINPKNQKAAPRGEQTGAPNEHEQ
ncbi:MAG: hypothetical protein DMG96_16395 [Acidobacteria bacterium]|nr:MAG: hypothetical protein DMG96_16395 [Acidobacteriota bacterium]